MLGAGREAREALTTEPALEQDKETIHHQQSSYRIPHPHERKAATLLTCTQNGCLHSPIHRASNPSPISSFLPFQKRELFGLKVETPGG